MGCAYSVFLLQYRKLVKERSKLHSKNTPIVLGIGAIVLVGALLCVLVTSEEKPPEGTVVVHTEISEWSYTVGPITQGNWVCLEIQTQPKRISDPQVATLALNQLDELVELAGFTCGEHEIVKGYKGYEVEGVLCLVQ